MLKFKQKWSDSNKKTVGIIMNMVPNKKCVWLSSGVFRV